MPKKPPKKTGLNKTVTSLDSANVMCAHILVYTAEWRDFVALKILYLKL